jgi:uncharacterized protein YjbJ (UPF0337 family)
MRRFNQEIKMNRDQAKGQVKDIAGKVQEKAGELTGSKENQAKGLLKQAEGKAQKGLGDLKDMANKADDKR